MILMVTLVVSRFDARAAFLRRMTSTLEGQLQSRTGELERAVHQHALATQALDNARLKIEQELIAQRETTAALTEQNERQLQEIDALKRTVESLLQSMEASVHGAPICALPDVSSLPATLASRATEGTSTHGAAVARKVGVSDNDVSSVDPDASADASMQRLGANLIALKARLHRMFRLPAIDAGEGELCEAPTPAPNHPLRRASDRPATQPDPAQQQVLTLVDETIDLALQR